MTYAPDNEFERKMELWSRCIPAGAPDVTGAMAFVHDSLELCQAAARNLFGDKTTTADVLAIYDRFYARCKDIEQAQQAEQERLGEE